MSVPEHGTPARYNASNAPALAAALLFTTEPTDRALAGWCAPQWAAIELEALGVLGAVTREAR